MGPGWGTRGVRRTLRLLAPTVLVLLLTGPASALELQAWPTADGFRPGRWTPVHLVVATQADPFEGEVVLRVGPAQVHRVPLSLPANARHEATVGVLPFRPSERVEVEAGGRRVAFDIRLAPGPLWGAEPSLLEAARRERGPGVAPLGEEDSALWEGFDEVLVSRETAMNRWLLPLEGASAWVRPVDRPWGLVWETSGEPRRAKIPSIQAAWVRLWPGAPWGASARRWFLRAVVGIALALAAGVAATRRRAPRTRGLVLGVLVPVSVIVAMSIPRPRPAVSALCIVGPVPSHGWQARGFGCASRGTRGDVELSLPHVPRPIFATLEDAQEASWEVVWETVKRKVTLVFPDRMAGQRCWFEWQRIQEIPGYMVPLRDGGAANEIRWTFSPAVLLVDGRTTVREALAAEESISPGPGDNLPAPFTPTLLGTLDPDWRRGRHFLGRAGQPQDPVDADWLDGQLWVWQPLD